VSGNGCVLACLLENQVLPGRDFFRDFGKRGDFLGGQRTVPNAHLIKDGLEARMGIVRTATKSQGAIAGLALETDFFFSNELPIDMEAHRFSVIRQRGVMPLAFLVELRDLGGCFVDVLRSTSDVHQCRDFPEGR